MTEFLSPAPSSAPGDHAAAPLTGDAFRALMAPFGLSPAAPVAVGVSGGADSMALLRLAHAAGLRVHALTVDHALRPGSGDEARQVAEWAGALGVPHVILTRQGPAPGANIQAHARAARYELLTRWCRSAGMAALLVAHTREDQAETFLLRLARGSGVDGLSAMARETVRDGVRLLRPLLDVPRARLEATLRARGQDWIEDPSNADPRHARVRMRALAPVLAAEGLDARRLAETARAMGRARTALEDWTRAHLARVARLDAAGMAVVDRRALLDAPEEIVLRSLSRLVCAVGGRALPPRLAQVERLAARLAGGRADFRGATLAGVSVAARRAGLVFMREPRAAVAAPVVRLGDNAPVVWDGRFEIRPQAGEAGLEVRALGAARWRALRARAPAHLARIPAAAGAALPALFAPGTPADAAGDALEDALIAVPHAGQKGGHVRFVGAARAGLEVLPEVAGDSPLKPYG